MRIKATYTGTDGSLGYQRGKSYTLQVSERPGFTVRLQIDSPVKCPYASLETFLNNWQSVSRVTDP